MPLTRGCVTTTMSGVPVGVQSAWLSCKSSGMPIDLTRTAPTNPALAPFMKEMNDIYQIKIN